MNTKLKKASLLGILGMAALTVASASAMGFGPMNNLTPDEIANRQTTQFQEQATLLGATLDEVKAAWATGKDFKTLAKEKGVTEDQLQAKMKANRDAEMKAQLATLVSKGVITQAQADSRLAFMQSKSTATTNNKHRGMRGGMRSMMGGFGFGGDR
jgi:uncharacterized protein YaiL (DUF2058 family)